MDVYIEGKKVRLSPKDILGTGGEAQVFNWRDKAVKIFHKPEKGWEQDRKDLWQMMHRIKLEKLRKFPQNLPKNVISPIALAKDVKGEIVGYVMPKVSGAEVAYMLSQKKFRQGGIDNSEVMEIFGDLGQAVDGLHTRSVIIGDFNDLNVLFKDQKSYLIDTDSMQFAGLPCVMATERFLDPLLFGQDFSSRAVFTCESDYYAFAVMLFQSLLYVHPYGGIHKGFKTMLRRAEAAVSVFDDQVKYPKAAIHYGVLPDELLNYFSLLFDDKQRAKLDLNLLKSIRWTECAKCGVYHARRVCPTCVQRDPALVQATVINGSCTATRVFQTRGRIILAELQGPKLRYLYEEGDTLRRETQQKVILEKADRTMRFALMGDRTLIGSGKKIAVIRNEKVEQIIPVGGLGKLPMFTSNQSDFFTLSGDYLAENDQEIVGQILENQTWFKVGPDFGFGFYRVGLKTVYFVFDAHKGFLNDNVKLPEIKGQLVDAECYFTHDSVLFTLSRVENGKTINVIYLLDKNGKLIAEREEEADNSRSLKTIRGKALGGNNVLCATDEGLLLLNPENGYFVEAKLFSDTEKFVDESCELISAAGGVYVISEKEIRLLRLS
ncbi:hypothetical protein HN858_04855 [Candidatus Falkowbacteria bacterium]|jgi:tRNA A-37 threonylcarbamoyl transferase component Bud32|nr:hypothetical protein [Candidatus Falkowbacteria bacterium]MBT6574420.1 hypothetical protein [Candidatus Falkowbacteria bacterium]MBT7348970.1 hypothetical protein [Candidatus Falkowbacteria bacterium]MBT7500303.1 hypothetical protein [Candidatus Falkowbacteria bacterium]